MEVGLQSLDGGLHLEVLVGDVEAEDGAAEDHGHQEERLQRPQPSMRGVQQRVDLLVHAGFVGRSTRPWPCFHRRSG